MEEAPKIRLPLFYLEFQKMSAPMTNDSTFSQFRTDNNDAKLAPRKSTLYFIRQFARVYMNIGPSELNSFIMN